MPKTKLLTETELLFRINKLAKGALFLDEVKAIIKLIQEQKVAHADMVIGEDEDLNAPPETYGTGDQSLGDNPHPNPNLQYVVRRATRNVYRAEQRGRNVVRQPQPKEVDGDEFIIPESVGGD